MTVGIGTQRMSGPILEQARTVFQMPQVRTSHAFIAAIAFSGVAASPLNAATAQATSPFSQYVETSSATVDYDPYNEIISALSVTERGRTLVAYDVARAQALPFFEQYVDYLAGIPVETLNRDEQLAYWLNTRNVLLIQALAEERRVSGFKRKRGTPQSPGAFWTEERITVSGTPLSLQDIEQDILFTEWSDPNIIFGLYQGIEGGPVLPREPFSGANVTSQLAEAGRIFVSSSRNLRVRRDSVRLTTYFDWYAGLAFDDDQARLREHLSTLVSADLKTVVRTEGNVSKRNLSTAFEQYRTRQAGAGSGTSGSRPVRGAGS